MAEIIPARPDNPFGLGRHVNHDPRSREYPVRSTPPAQLKSVEWVRRVPIFDQGQLGSCTGNAAGGWLGTDNSVRQGLTEASIIMSAASKVSVPVDEALAVEIYHEATVLDPYQGTYPPDDTGSDGLSVAKVLKSMGVVDVYQHAFSLSALQSALQTSPAMLGTEWLQNMFNPDKNGVVTLGGSVAGGHEYLCVGFDAGDLGWPAPFKFANSWGPGWGMGGYFFMSADTVTKLLKAQGDVTVPHALAGPPPPPPPGTRTVTKVTVEYSDHTTTVLP
jgi:hypothetical protein